MSGRETLPESRFLAIREAKRLLMRHSNQFYGPLKGERCGCDECKVIRGLLAELEGQP